MRLGVVGLQPDRCVIARKRLVETMKGAERIAQIGVRLGDVRADCDRLGDKFRAALGPAGSKCQAGKPMQRIQMMRLEVQCFLIEALGFRDATGKFFRHAPPEFGMGVFWRPD